MSAPSVATDEAHLARSSRQARDRALHHDAVDGHEHAPCANVGIGHQVVHRVHRRDRGLDRIERREHIAARPVTDPGRHDLVELVAMAGARSSEVANRGSSPWPRSLSTRCATDSVDVEIAIHLPSPH